MSTFSEHFEQIPFPILLEKAQKCSPEQVQKTLEKTQFTLQDLPILLSDSSDNFIENMAQRAHKLSIQRFGNTMQFFAPLYISSVCSNICTYCGFSMDREYKRVILSDEEILKEGQILKEKGFDHILLLTGEAQKQVGADFIANAVSILSPLFSSVGIEVQPLTLDEYKTQIQSGADQLTIYQETYHPEYYKKYHLKGNKSNYGYRLDTPDRGGQAQFYKMNLGVLLGLYDWKYEAIALAYHIDYLQKRYWRTKYSVSFPRIKNMGDAFKVPFEADDKTLVKLICAFRLIFPDIGITLSTREPASLRDALIKIGITTISAESKTEPGGYSGKEAHGQFEISDERSIEDMKKRLKEAGYDPVIKDWDHAYINSTIPGK